MQVRTIGMLVIAALALASGCGGSAADEAPAAKPESAPVVPIALATSGGATPRRAEEPEQAPSPVEVRIRAPSPIGPLEAASAPGYRVEVALENRGERAVPVAPLSIQLTAFEGIGVDPVAGCERVEPVEVDAPAVLAPRGELSVSVPLSCGLPSPGTYRLVAVAILGDRGPDAVAPRAVLVSGTTDVVVDGTLPPHGR